MLGLSRVNHIGEMDNLPVVLVCTDNSMVLPGEALWRPHPGGDSQFRLVEGKTGVLVWMGRALLHEARGVDTVCLRDQSCDDFYSCARGWQLQCCSELVS